MRNKLTTTTEAYGSDCIEQFLSSIEFTGLSLIMIKLKLPVRQYSSLTTLPTPALPGQAHPTVPLSSLALLGHTLHYSNFQHCWVKISLSLRCRDTSSVSLIFDDTRPNALPLSSSTLQAHLVCLCHPRHCQSTDFASGILGNALQHNLFHSSSALSNHISLLLSHMALSNHMFCLCLPRPSGPQTLPLSSSALPAHTFCLPHHRHYWFTRSFFLCQRL